MRRFAVVAAFVFALPFATGAGCDRNSDCPDDTEAISASVSYKPTCKPTNKGPQWIEPSVKPS